MTMFDDNGDGKQLLLITCYIILLILATICLAGCTRTVYVPTPEYHEIHDTVVHNKVIEKEVIREVAVKDSSSFQVRGDTVYVYRYRYERDYTYEKRLQATIDSLSHATRDTVTVTLPPTEVVKEVEKPLKKWQKYLIWWGALSVILSILHIVHKFRL